MKPLLAAAVVGLLSAGCLQAGTAQCADGLICPPGEVCAGNGRCAPPGQIEVCDGKDDGIACTFDEIVGVCTGGVCQISSCGNGVVEEGEVCDEGDQIDGDGCSRDCLSTEVCGNEIVDDSVGEVCDTDVFAAGDCTGASYDYGRLECTGSCALDESRCGLFGFAPLLQFGPAQEQSPAVWGFPGGKVVVAGVAEQTNRLSYHFDGQRWTLHTLGLEAVIGIWGRTESDVYVIGEALGFLGAPWALHFDGSGWSPLVSDVRLTKIWGNDDGVFATGADALWKLDGTSFTQVVELPASNGLWGPPQGPLFSLALDAINKIEGTTVTPIPIPASFATSRCGSFDRPKFDCDIIALDRCISGISESEIYLVGSEPPAVLRFDGSSWDCLWANTGPGNAEVVSHVHAYAPGKAAVAISNFGIGTAGFVSGDEFTVLPWAPTGRPSDFWAGAEGRAYATAESRLYSVGAADWLPPFLLVEDYYLERAAASESDFVAVGDAGTTYRGIDGLWSGLCEAEQASAAPCASDAPLHDVWAGAGIYYAVGDRGIIVKNRTSATTVPVPGDLFAIDGLAESNLFAAGEAGALVHFDGELWSVLSSGTGSTLRDLVANGEGAIAVGDGGAVVRIVGTTAEIIATGLTVDLLAVWATGDSVFIGSSDGRLYSLEGDELAQVAELPVATAINAIAGPLADDLFIGTRAGLLYHYDGTAMSRVRFQGSGEITGLASLGTRVVAIASGQLYELVRVRPF